MIGTLLHIAEQPSSVPINFHFFSRTSSKGELIGTLLGCSTLLIEGLEQASWSAVPARPREGFLHLWALVGHLFGIPVRLNPLISKVASAKSRGPVEQSSGTGDSQEVYQYSRIVMQSIFAYAIPEKPEIGGVLSNHVIAAVADGERADLGNWLR